MKHYKSIVPMLAMILALASSLPAMAYDFEQDGIYYNITSVTPGNYTCEVTYGDYPYAGNVKIPQTVVYNGKTLNVKTIGNAAFFCCTSLISIEFPDGLESIGDDAFRKCESIKKLKFPNSVTYIGSGAFIGCSSVEEILLPNNIECMNTDVFWGNLSLKYIKIPKCVKEIKAEAFAYCWSLETVEFEGNVNYIAPRVYNSKEAFYDCPLTNLIVSNNVELGIIGSQNTKTRNITIKENFAGGKITADLSKYPELESITIKTPYPATYTGTFTNTQYANITLYVPADMVEMYQQAAVWKNFFNIKVITEGNKDVDAPAIDIVGGKLSITSSTEGAVCNYTIACDDAKSGTVTENETIALSGLYTITAYATKDGYGSSEPTTAKLVWVDPTIKGSDVISMEAKKAILIRSNGSSLQLSGTEQGETIELYDLSGKLISSAIANDGETTVPCNIIQKGSVIVLKYGLTAVKCRF